MGELAVRPVTGRSFRLPMVLLSGGLLLASCDGAAERHGGPAPTPSWEDPVSLDPDGGMRTDDFNAFLRSRDPASAGSAIRTVVEFLRLGDLNGDERLTIRLRNVRPALDGGDRAVATVTIDGIPDDSVHALRYVVRLRRGPDGAWHLEGASWSQRCRPGRGHQVFAPEACA